MSEAETPNPSPAPEGARAGIRSWPHKALLRRAVAWDLSTIQPTPAELGALRAAVGAPVSERAAAYFAWRRGGLFLGLAAGAATLVFALIGMIGSIADAEGMPQGGSVLILVALAEFGAKVFLVAVLYMAVARWTDAIWTRRMVRRAWLVALLTPVVIAMIPFVSILMGSGSGGGFGAAPTTQQLAQRDFVGLLIAILAFWQAAPAVLSLFPGLLRAAMAMKTGFPGRGLGPVVGASITPVYALFLAAFLVQVQQLVSSFVMLIGIVLFVLAPLAYGRRAVALFRPMSLEEAREGVGRVRASMRWLQLAAFVLILIPLLSKKLFGVIPIVGFADPHLISAWSLVSLFLWFVVMISAYTVVAADGMVQAMRETEVRVTELGESEAWRADSKPVEEIGGLLGPLGLGGGPDQRGSDPDREPA